MPKFPFTNYHELNLDWILKKVNALFDASEENARTIRTYDTRLNSAEQTATSAATAATSAQQLADAAAANADNALSVAGTADAKADSALTAATDASSAVSGALTIAQEAQQTASAAVATANDAAATAAGLESLANTANQNATAAVETAVAAQQTANTADQKAVAAQQTANSAQAAAATNAGNITTLQTYVTDLNRQISDLDSSIELISNEFEYNGIPQNVEKLSLVNSQITDAISKGITLTKISDTSFTLNGTATAGINFHLDFNSYELSENMYYYFKRSDNITAQTGVYVQTGYFNENGTPTQLSQITAFNTIVPYTYPSAAKKPRNYLHIDSGSVFNNVRFDMLAFKAEPTIQQVNSIVNYSIDRYDSIMFSHPITTVSGKKLYAHSGDTIIINVSSNTIATNAFINPYIGGDPYITLAVGSGTYKLIANKDGWLTLQNTATVISASAYIESRLDTKIANLEQQITTGGETYTVKKDGTGDFTSFTNCLKYLESNQNQKTIYIYDGVYDIYEEMGGDAYIATITNPSGTNWRSVSTVVPPNTKVIGCGNVTLKFTPTAKQIGSNEMAYLFSPLNVSGNCEIENIAVEATNCRYAIHDESSGLAQFDDTVHVYKNVRAHKTKGTYGYNPTFASGLGARCRWTFDNCKFSNDIGVCWTVHTTTSTALDMATIVFDSCIFTKDDGTGQPGMLQFINGGGAHLSEKEIVNINNCYIGGAISLSGGGGSTNRYSLSILHTHMGGDVVVDSTITTNPYTPEVYT